MFESNQCLIFDTTIGKLKGIGKAFNGLYYLIDEPIQYQLDAKKQHNVSTTLQVLQVIQGHPLLTSTNLWHSRLGLIPLTKLTKLSDFFNLRIVKGDICVTCPMANFTKLPYSTSLLRAPSIFDLIHLDIWGPYKVSCRKNRRFFFTIVDDHSRMTWFHLLKQKSDTFSVIEIFVNMAKTQFDKKIKTIRTDNALELDDK